MTIPRLTEPLDRLIEDTERLLHALTYVLYGLFLLLGFVLGIAATRWGWMR